MDRAARIRTSLKWKTGYCLSGGRGGGRDGEERNIHLFLYLLTVGMVEEVHGGK